MSDIAYIDKIIEEFVPDFIKDRKMDVDRMRELLEKEDFDEIIKITKIGEESANTFGFKMLTALYISMLNASRKRDVDRMAELLESMHRHLKTLKIVYVEYGDDDQDEFKSYEYDGFD